MQILSTTLEVQSLAATLAQDASALVSFDLESDGLFAYRAGLCVVQLAVRGEVFVVDPLACSLEPLTFLIGADGPIKLVHDCGFDARLLAESGIHIGNVHDTSIAARMLGRAATGLGSLLASELGLTVDKSLQHHDWRVRPFTEAQLAYLRGDVIHLESLHDKLWSEVRAKDIEDEVLEETSYRIRSAIQSAETPDARPAYVRMKGVDKLAGAALAIVRRLAAAREDAAYHANVPPYKIATNEALFAIAVASPKNRDAMNALPKVPRVRSDFVSDALSAVSEGLNDGAIPAEDRVWFVRPTLPSEVARARKFAQARLMAWRKEAAKARDVDEQVILPGHCLKSIVEEAPRTPDEMASVDGIGAFRVTRYGEAIVRALNPQGGI